MKEFSPGHLNLCALLLTKDIVGRSAPVEQVSRDAFSIVLQHRGPHYHPMRDLRDLSKEFAHVRPSKHRLGPDDCGSPVAENIVFDPVWVHFFPI